MLHRVFTASPDGEHATREIDMAQPAPAHPLVDRLFGPISDPSGARVLALARVGDQVIERRGVEIGEVEKMFGRTHAAAVFFAASKSAAVIGRPTTRMSAPAAPTR